MDAVQCGPTDVARLLLKKHKVEKRFGSVPSVIPTSFSPGDKQDKHGDSDGGFRTQNSATLFKHHM